MIFTSHLTRRLILLIIISNFGACSTLKTPSKTITKKQDARITLSSVVPVLSSIAQELCENTIIDANHLAPKRYSIKRIPGWIKRQTTESFPHSDIALGMSSVWPAINLYPSLRTTNIGVIPIDAAQALIPGGERVAITPTEGLPAYFWLSPANAMMMIGIVHRDLLSIIEQSDLEKETKKVTIHALKTNSLSMLQNLRTIQINIDLLLQSSEVMQVAINKQELSGLAAATLLPEVSLQEATSNTFKTLYISNKPKGHSTVSDLSKHITVWHIDDFSKLRAGSFTQRWAQSLSALEETSKTLYLTQGV